MSKKVIIYSRDTETWPALACGRDMATAGYEGSAVNRDAGKCILKKTGFSLRLGG
jgi:hypothetical protein